MTPSLVRTQLYLAQQIILVFGGAHCWPSCGAEVIQLLGRQDMLVVGTSGCYVDAPTIFAIPSRRGANLLLSMVATQLYCTVMLMPSATGRAVTQRLRT